MTFLRALVAAVIAAFVAATGRLRARWYAYRKLPRVSESLAKGELPPASITALKAGDEPLAADDRSPDYLSIPSSTKLVHGDPAPVFRVASTRILPKPPRELAVLSNEPWNVEVRRAMSSPAAPHAPPEPLAKPAYFGLDSQLASTRAERAFAGPKLVPLLLRERPAVVPSPKPAPRDPLGVADPEAFGLDESLRPFAEAVPAPRRHPMRLPRARADFHARYVEPHRSETLVKPLVSTWGDYFENTSEQLEFDTDLGAVETFDEWELDDELDKQREEVREQFILRRDIDRYEYGKDDLGKLEGFDGEVLAAIEAFSGLEFEDLEPEPWAPLKMRLDAPPPDMKPFVEDSEAQLRWLLSAIKEHPPEDVPPRS